MRRNTPFFSATLARLLFFGVRYLSLLMVAQKLGKEAAGFLLTVAIVEVLRVVFDYGMENSILGRLHQQKDSAGVAFLYGKGSFRLYVTIIGQVFTSMLVGILCRENGTSLELSLVASLQFSCLTSFGYLQAHLQTGKPGGMAALVFPLTLAGAVQALLLWLASVAQIPLFLCTITFEVMALAACMYAIHNFGDRGLALPEAWTGLTSSRAIFIQIAPLGNVALIGIVYSRLDSLAMSLVTGGTLLTQYLIYQRLASAPLMFFSTVASASIPSFSAASSNPDVLERKIKRYRQLAYTLACASGIALSASSPFVAKIFSLEKIDYGVMAAQSAILAFQIANGFHAAILIAQRRINTLWQVAKKNAIAAIIVLSGAMWIGGGFGIAVGLCIIEAFCTLQYVQVFRKSTYLPENSCA